MRIGMQPEPVARLLHFYRLFEKRLSMIVCICQNVSDRKIRQAVDAGASTMPQLRDSLGVGTCCGKCHPHAKQVLRECLENASRQQRDQMQPLIFQCNPMAA
jgi:bacterioferritin-associated ferredoxin